MSQIEKVVVSAQQNIQPKQTVLPISINLPVVVDSPHDDLDEAHTPLPPGVAYVKRTGIMY